jgi:hypothetical protein
MPHARRLAMKTTVLALLALCACGAVNEVDGAGGDCGAGGAAQSSAASAGTGNCRPCERPEPPRRLRQVSARDSRALDPWTLVRAVAPEPQTFWLPDAAGSLGASIIVKEATGTNHRVTVLTTGGDLFEGDGSTEHESTEAWSSRTFVAWELEDVGQRWVLLDH